MRHWLLILHDNRDVDWVKNPKADGEKYHVGKHDYFARPNASYRHVKRLWWTLWIRKDVTEYELFRFGHPNPLTIKADGELEEPILKTMKRLGDVNESRLIADILGKSGMDWNTFLFGLCAGAVIGIIGGIVAATQLMGK